MNAKYEIFMNDENEITSITVCGGGLLYGQGAEDCILGLAELVKRQRAEQFEKEKNQAFDKLGHIIQEHINKYGAITLIYCDEDGDEYNNMPIGGIGINDNKMYLYHKKTCCKM